VAKDNNTITFEGEIPGVSANSYINFSVYSVNPYIADTICK
jgi:hypothetical protein